MGVTGLWRLIEPAGKPVPVETLENKILAVDISIWLHQMVKGYQDAKGAPLPNAHLIGLFQRLCKLLYFRIKPVFVFDGGVPDLKRQTIAKRQDNKLKYNSESERIKRELALLIGKKTAVGALLGKQISPKKINTNANDEDIFKLPELPQKETESDTESDDEDSSASTVDLHTVDLESQDFKNMPSKEKYDLLLELKETRKMNSWGKLHTLPKRSDSFSDFQMQRLLKRRKVQECIEETEKEIGDVGMSLNDLETLLNEEGINTNIEDFPSRRIASDQSTRYLLINNVKQALADAKKKKELELEKENKLENETVEVSSNEGTKFDELEDDLQKAIKMSLECVDDTEPSVRASTSNADESWTSCMTDSNSDYSDEEEEYLPQNITSAKAYIMQYSDFTHKAIDDIILVKNKQKAKAKEINVEEIIAQLNNEETIIEEHVEVSSEEELNKPQMLTSCFVEKNNIDDNVGDPTLSNTTIEVLQKTENNIVNDDSSIMYVENNKEDVISLDSSEENSKVIISLDDTSNLSNSSDDDFEEVSETDDRPKPVVQLTLNLEDEIEDDIFSDVFESKQEVSNIKLNQISSPTKIKTQPIKSPLKDVSVPPVKEIIAPKIDNEMAQDKTNVKTDTPINNINKNDECINDDQSTAESVNIEEISNMAGESSENSILKHPEAPKNHIEPITKERLETMEVEMENEQQELLHQKGRLDRVGRNISEQMTKDAQELLQVFGIPYIVAPMEAEAQCAFLEDAKLTDGTITDDSDIWLFGGKTVYKNFFNQKKHVLQFLSERIERSFNLSREQLILLALLVGSDYTTGVNGIGPVTAMEILASFPFNKKKLSELSNQAQYQQILTGLQEFKQWVRAGKRTDNIKLKKKLKNVSLTDEFPSIRVVQAYLEPYVEKSKEKFTWGNIDITILRDYTKDKFGWSQNKLDEIIKPVLKRLLDRKNQKTVHDYFKRKIVCESLDEQMSKRVKAAVQKMDPNSQNDVEDVSTKKDKKGKTARKRKVENDELKNIDGIVKVAKSDDKPEFNFIVPKTDACHELIPQKEKAKQSLLQNKMKAIEIFRKTKIDRKRKYTKKKPLLPKDKAELSESSDSN
ncbi:DNA excision repair protein ERCC-5 homolog isoform X1 [Pieris rapae]|uniref:DNA excision repair protein ERCC-5 homolog isoform X1 n=2 Tax=Pieris rapae TaxID=64459 RepID=UPI001E27B013|nr:DNA excision repair protein ERCC-5 homolog isoform X1 [Pieris rapae]